LVGEVIALWRIAETDLLRQQERAGAGAKAERNPATPHVRVASARNERIESRIGQQVPGQRPLVQLRLRRHLRTRSLQALLDRALAHHIHARRVIAHTPRQLMNNRQRNRAARACQKGTTPSIQ
jgi:hypothetical protein